MNPNVIIPVNFSTEKLAELEVMFKENFPNTFYLINYKQAKINGSDRASRELIFLHANGDQKSARIKMWQLQKTHPDLPLVLCDSDITSAYLAWKAGAFYFLRLPFSALEIMRLAEKLSSQLSGPMAKIRFNHLNGYTLVDPSEICFCASDGNYTEIYLRDNRKVVVTKKLKELEDIFRDITFLYRIGKGHILNLNRIRNIHYQLVSFEGIDAPVKFSEIYLQRIKSALLWYI
ncbi:MAG: LytR/AlgR family response regulator transcription factor [Lentimicrobium sp.]